MIRKIVSLASASIFSGAIDIETRKFKIEGEDQATQLDLTSVFDNKIIYFAKHVDSTGKLFEFKHLVWPDENELGELSNRLVSLKSLAAGVVGVSVGPLRPWSSAEEIHYLNRSVLDSLENAIVITESEPFHEPGPRIVYVNQAFERITGYSSKEILGKTPRILQGPETSDIFKFKIREALTSCAPVKVELVNYRKDGSHFDVELTISPVRDEMGWWTHSIAVQRDLTDEKFKQEMRMAASRMEIVETMASGIAHDLNNQLATISNLMALTIQDLQKAKPNQARINENLETAQRKLVDAQSITRQFMNLNRHDADIKPIQSIASEIQKVVQLCMAGTTVELKFRSLTGETTDVAVDFGVLTQVVSNVVINAVQAFSEPMDDSRSLRRVPCVSVLVDTVSADRFEDQFVRVVIEDNGPGISESIQSRLFSPYATNKRAGTGLGLFVSQANMANIGGYLALKRTSADGTVFEIGFPRWAVVGGATPMTVAVSSNTAVEMNRQSHGSLSRELPVLVIDDQSELAQVIAEILEGYGLKVETAFSADEAFQKIESGSFSFILSDLNLGGSFITDKIVLAAKQKNPEQRIGLMSGGNINGDERMADVLEKFKDLVVLTKPFDGRDIEKLYQSDAS